MSLPIPTTSGTTIHSMRPQTQMTPRELQALDAPLIALTNQCGGDLRRLMYSYFSFLHRRTDFYLVPGQDHLDEKGAATMGFLEGDAEKVLLAAFRQFPLRRIPSKKSTEASKAAVKEATTTVPVKEAVKAAVKDAAKEGATEPVKSKAATATESKPTALRRTEEGLQIPVGNGGSTDRYKWTQTIDECSVLVGIPGDLRAKDLAVTIRPSIVSVRTKKPLDGQDTVQTFLEGDLTQKVVPDESTWTLEGGVMVLQLYKQAKGFWKTVVTGDDEIDTALVDSRRHMRDYDESTQAQIRKIMFDQNQARQGLPGSQTQTADSGKPVIPPLPDGVEYIDEDVLKRAEAAKKK